jgi:hypothetical protein
VTLGEGIRGISIPGGVRTFPVSSAIVEELNLGNSGGDTTGAGDNFVGGMIYSIGMQLSKGTKEPDLAEAVKWGIVSGGFACFYMGGTYLEKTKGEKLEMLNRYYELYHQQLEDA